MSERKVVDWFTSKGKHIPIYEGESKQDALNRSIVLQNEEKKQSDIQKNAKEASQRNNKTIVSNVDTKTTPMSDADAEYLGNSNYQYFQSPNAFDINNALRLMADDGNLSLDDALIQAKAPSDYIDGLKQTIKVMNRNMQPIDKPMNVARYAGKQYLSTLMNKLDFVNSDMLDRLMSDGSPYDPPFLDNNDVDIIKKHLLGVKITEGAYMSAMYSDEDIARNIGKRPIVLELALRKGTRGMFSPTKKESEFVISRNSTYEITNVRLGKVDGVNKLIISATI